MALSVGVTCAVAAGLHANAILVAAVAAVLVWLSAIDLQVRLVPNRIVLPAAAVTLLAQVAIAPSRAPECLLSAVLASSLLFLASLIRPGGLGMGDVKLALLLGAALGRLVGTALVLGFAATGIAGVVLFLDGGRDALRRQIPLCPFLAFGAIAAFLLDTH